MLQMGSVLRVIDNSGVRFLRCIKVLNVSDRPLGFAGDTIIGSVIDVKSRRKVEKGTIQQAVIVGTRKGFVRKSGFKVEFDINCAVLVDPKGNPLGTRVLGPISDAVRRSGKFSRVISLSLKTV